jgi:DNA-binding CsgD family transcriptional regulator
VIDETRLRHLIDQLPCSASSKRLDSVFSYSNTHYAHIVGLKNGLDVVGRTAYDMPARSSDCAALSHAQDQKVIQSARRLALLGIHPDAQGQFKAYRFMKTPMCERDGSVAGIFVTGEDITSKVLYDLSEFLMRMPIFTNGKLLLDSGAYLIGTDHAEIEITEREHEVLFYSLRKQRAKAIADLLGITPRTVYKHMHSLREKFGAHTSAELRDQACELGYTDILPPSIFDEKIVAALVAK